MPSGERSSDSRNPEENYPRENWTKFPPQYGKLLRKVALTPFKKIGNKLAFSQ